MASEESRGRLNKVGGQPLWCSRVLRHKLQCALGLPCPWEARQGGQRREGASAWCQHPAHEEDHLSLSWGHWNLDLDARSLPGDGIILP